MGKTLLLISFLCLGFVSIGTSIFPQNPMFWLASAAPSYQYLRELLVFVLVIQLTTSPPRHMWFRIISGAVALVLAIWCVRQTYDNQMQLLDSLSLLGTSIAIGISAIERKANILALVRIHIKKNIPVRYIRG
jgi:hypothetical protein